MLSRNFRLQKVGNLQWLKTNYDFSCISFSIDELIVLDVTRGIRNSEAFHNALKSIAEGCFVPIAAGGGVRTIQHAYNLLRSGADKVVINTALYENKGLPAELASEFGQQCVVASMDIRQTSDGGYCIITDYDNTILEGSVPQLIKDVVDQPIGELYLNSVDRDGTGQGYDLGILDFLPQDMSKPVILVGGAGNASHLAEGLNDPRVDAVATAHLFNFVNDGLKQARKSLITGGVQLPMWNLKQLDTILGKQ